MKPIENEANERQRRSASDPAEPELGCETTELRAANAGARTNMPTEKETWGLMQQPTVDVQGHPL